MRLPGRSRKVVDPHQPHHFREPDRRDTAAGAASPLLNQGPTALYAVTNASMRVARCAVPGCDKEREAPIHEPQES
jgi:hypothetical protein